MGKLQESVPIWTAYKAREDPSSSGNDWEEANMLRKGVAKKVTIFVNEDTQHHFSSLCDSILTFLLHRGVSGATATRAMAGFGAHQVMHTTKVEVLTQHLPIRIEFIESAEKVEELMPTLYDMVTDGVIEVQNTEVIKVANKDRPAPSRGPHAERKGSAQLMRIYMGESDKWKGEPLYEAIVKRLRLMDIAGATVYRGILGYGAKGHTHRSGRFPFSHDLPVMITVVDSEEKLAQALGEIESMMQDGIIVLSDVDVIRLVHSRPELESSHANG
jgi:PII-like signaling protein